LPEGLSLDAQREACRALRGQMLRSEVYALDKTEKESIPYLVEEKCFAVKQIQTIGENKYGVFLVSDAEAISYHYERETSDPRILHALTLHTDDYGNVLQSAQVAYPRRAVTGVTTEQNCIKITETKAIYINNEGFSLNQIGINYESFQYEVENIAFTWDTPDKLDADTLKGELDAASVLKHHEAFTTEAQKRLFQHQRSTFYSEDLLSELGFGSIAKHALPYKSYTAEFSDGFLTQLTQQQPGITAARLTNEAKYVPADGMYWIPSERQVFNASAFYLPTEVVDPLNHSTTLQYDSYNLFIESIKDALNYITQAENNYRVLQPSKITDPNGNAQAVAFDALGMVKAQAVMGANSEGDTLEKPTIAYDYDLMQWQNHQKPVYAHVRTRETHADDNTAWMESYVYSGGHGNMVMTKVQAENGNVQGVPCTDRWVGTGRTVFNNKGKVIKQYEPYFSDTSAYEDETTVTQNGVTPIFYYDPIGRNIKTEFPDGTLAKVEFTPWQQKNYDQNDTVLNSQWYSDLGSPDPEGAEPAVTEPAEVRAAWLAAKHANTPQVRHFDNLGREYEIVDHNRYDKKKDDGSIEIVNEFYSVHNTLDIAGRPVKVTDAKGRKMTTLLMSMQQSWKTYNIDSNVRWVLNDVMGKPLYQWDSRNHQTEFDYDALNRPLLVYLSDLSASVVEKIIVEKTIYGTDATKNNIGQAEKSYDQGGETHIESYDFKGNPLLITKTYAQEYTAYIDWKEENFEFPTEGSPYPVPGLLALESFIETFVYDALNRPIEHYQQLEAIKEGLLLNKDLSEIYGSKTTYVYNKAGLLNAVANKDSIYVNNIDYNEKGQRTKIEYGNGSFTNYLYDDKTFRLKQVLTYKNIAEAEEEINNRNIKSLQNLNYTYDPVGNIVEIVDLAQKTKYYANAQVEPRKKYTYDALYRILSGEGRELIGLAKANSNGFALGEGQNISDKNAIHNYTQYYEYDQLGNIKKLQHVTPTSSYNWTRNFEYDGNTNRLTKHDASQTEDSYTYDAHGNMLSMPHLQAMHWDFKDQLIGVNMSACKNNLEEGETQPESCPATCPPITDQALCTDIQAAYYVYDANGVRVKKVVKKGIIREERYYLGNYELYRKFVSGILKTERTTVKVSDDKSPIALLEKQTIETVSTEGGELAQLSNAALVVRYQLTDHLGSACIELNENAEVISYEEYHPFGTTSYLKHNTDISQKRYKYVGKERDEESGLYYYGARYYAGWLCRFISTDPEFMQRSWLNPYNYVQNNPINRIDPDGRLDDVPPWERYSTQENPIYHEGYEETTVASKSQTTNSSKKNSNFNYKGNIVITMDERIANRVNNQKSNKNWDAVYFSSLEEMKKFLTDYKSASGQQVNHVLIDTHGHDGTLPINFIEPDYMHISTQDVRDYKTNKDAVSIQMRTSIYFTLMDLEEIAKQVEKSIIFAGCNSAKGSSNVIKEISTLDSFKNLDVYGNTTTTTMVQRLDKTAPIDASLTDYKDREKGSWKMYKNGKLENPGNTKWFSLMLMSEGPAFKILTKHSQLTKENGIRPPYELEQQTNKRFFVN
jgi:RHS repeat-associated protein